MNVMSIQLGVTLLAIDNVNRTAAPARAQTAHSLADCFRLAAARSDSLAGDVELIRQAEESIRQVRANFLPTATFGLTYLRQQTPPEAIGQNLFPSSQQTEQFTVTQSLFKGFQDLSTLRQRKSLKRASADLSPGLRSGWYFIASLR